MAFKVPEKYRDAIFSGPEDGNNGMFRIPGRTLRETLTVIASDGGGWEHVSVSTPYRCPTWDEMCHVKSLFWDSPEDMAVQYHPPRSEYVNNHSYCLHLWRSIEQSIPLPPSWMVGLKTEKMG